MGRFLRVVLGTLIILVLAAGVMLLMRGTGFDSVWYTDDADAFRRESLPVEFTVATYNVQGRPLMDDTKGKFPEIGRRLEPFDIVGIQECFVDYDKLFEAADFPAMVYHGTLRSRFKLVGSGLANMGRFPLLVAEDMEYSYESMHFTTKGEPQNRPASKGILLTRFDIGGHTLDVYNTHMEAGGSEEAAKARLQQVDELVAFVAANSPRAHSVIFMGDFNMRPLRDHHGPEEEDSKFVGFQRMVNGLGEEFRDASDEIHGIPGPTNDENHDAPWRRRPGGAEDIDRILFRAGEGVSLEPLTWHKHIEDFRGDDGDLLSDHDPVSVRFRLEAR